MKEKLKQNINENKSSDWMKKKLMEEFIKDFVTNMSKVSKNRDLSFYK